MSIESSLSGDDAIRARIRAGIALKNELLETSVPIIRTVSERIVEAYRNGRETFWFGNGGSAADAQHLAGELVNRFYFDRKGLRSQAFTVNSSVLTAVANDYSYERVFEKQVEAFARAGDVLVGISTSGNAPSVVNALKLGRRIGTVNVGFTGRGGGRMAEHLDYLIAVPSEDTPLVQECHIMIGHIICSIVERELFRGEGAR